MASKKSDAQKKVIFSKKVKRRFRDAPLNHRKKLGPKSPDRNRSH